MSRLTWMLALLLSALALCPPPASAQERVQADVSTRDIAIGHNFTGTRVVVFGTIEDVQPTLAAQGRYGIAIVIRGPDGAVTVRQKKRRLGFWLNATAMSFSSVPSYYAVLSNSPLAELGSSTVLQHYGIGQTNLDFDGAADIPSSGKKRLFRDAVIRLKREDGLFQADPYGVTFIGQSLFRATVDLPADVPVGEFTAEVSLFKDKALIARNLTRMTIEKRGFERAVYLTAFDYPLLYGLGSVALAMATGLIGWTLSRRD